MTEQENIRERLRGLWSMPLAFLGFALWRAWVSMTYAAPVAASTMQTALGKAPFDTILALSCLVLALSTRWAAPLNAHRWPHIVSGVTMVAGSLMNIACFLVPEQAPLLFWPATVLSACGASLLILIWCELFACLGATRMAGYYALCMIAGVVASFLLEGYTLPYLLGCIVILPVMSLACSRHAFKSLGEADLPAPVRRKHKLVTPWKLLAVLVLYETVFGFCTGTSGGDLPSSLVGTHSTVATLIASLIVLASITFPFKKLDPSFIYRSPAVLMVSGILLVPLFGAGGQTLRAFCASMSLSLFSSFMFLFLCDFSKRTSIPAMWLFGLEETMIVFDWPASQLAVAVGNQAAWLGDANTIANVVIVVLVVALSALLLSSKELGARWGLSFIVGSKTTDPEEIRLRALAAACDEASSAYGLTAREREVVELLARGKSLSAVGRDLFIAEGTAKAHTRHIYEKMGVNSRTELFEKLGVNPS